MHLFVRSLVSDLFWVVWVGGGGVHKMSTRIRWRSAIIQLINVYHNRYWINILFIYYKCKFHISIFSFEWGGMVIIKYKLREKLVSFDWIIFLVIKFKYLCYNTYIYIIYSMYIVHKSEAGGHFSTGDAIQKIDLYFKNVILFLASFCKIYW